MSARSAVALGLVAVLVVLSGCADFPGVGPDCGPGETDIDDASTDDQVRIKGEVTEVGSGHVVIWDGTASASVPLTDAEVSEVAADDCLIVEGTVTGDGAGEADVEISATTVLLEEYVVEDEDEQY